MKNFKTILMLTALISLTAIGCKKGDTGPIGPAGANGVDGINGVNGINGLPGPSAKYYDFSVSIPISTTYAFYSLINTIYSNGDAVIVYWKDFSNNWLVQIPYIYKTSSSTIGANFWSEVTSVALFIHTTRADGSAGTPWSGTANLDFRAVVIKASVRIANPNVNYNDYNAVKKAFNLKD